MGNTPLLAFLEATPARYANPHEGSWDARHAAGLIVARAATDALHGAAMAGRRTAARKPTRAQGRGDHDRARIALLARDGTAFGDAAIAAFVERLAEAAPSIGPTTWPGETRHAFADVVLGVQVLDKAKGRKLRIRSCGMARGRDPAGFVHAPPMPATFVSPRERSRWEDLVRGAGDLGGNAVAVTVAGGQAGADLLRDAFEALHALHPARLAPGRTSTATWRVVPATCRQMPNARRGSFPQDGVDDAGEREVHEVARHLVRAFMPTLGQGSGRGADPGVTPPLCVPEPPIPGSETLRLAAAARRPAKVAALRAILVETRADAATTAAFDALSRMG